MKMYRVYDPVFEQDFVLCTDCTYREFNDYANEFADIPNEYDEKSACTFGGLTVDTDKGGILIFMPSIDLDDLNIMARFVHELHHATEFSLIVRRNVDRRESEVPAYYEQFLYREFVHKIKEGIIWDDEDTRDTGRQ